MNERRPPGTLGAAWLVARKDLAIEFRTRTAFLSALVFAVLALAIFYFTWDESIVTAADRAPGVLWVVLTSRRCSDFSVRSGSRSMIAGSTRSWSRRSAASRSTSARRSGT